jgi:hypothetical protein
MAEYDAYKVNWMVCKLQQRMDHTLFSVEDDADPNICEVHG